MDSDVENLIKGCLPCLSTTPAPPPPAPIASAPQLHLHGNVFILNFLGPYLAGEILLVAIFCIFTLY